VRSATDVPLDGDDLDDLGVWLPALGIAAALIGGGWSMLLGFAVLGVGHDAGARPSPFRRPAERDAVSATC
jgi:hypothetical protein